MNEAVRWGHVRRSRIGGILSGGRYIIFKVMVGCIDCRSVDANHVHVFTALTSKASGRNGKSIAMVHWDHGAVLKGRQVMHQLGKETWTYGHGFNEYMRPFATIIGAASSRNKLIWAIMNIGIRSALEKEDRKVHHRGVLPVDVVAACQGITTYISR